MRHVLRIRLFLVVLVGGHLLSLPFAYAQDTWDRYKEGTIAGIIIQERDNVAESFSTPAHHVAVSAENFPTRTSVLYMDSLRSILPENLEVIRHWAVSLRVDPAALTAFQHELLFREDTLDFWLPVQEVLVPSFRAELRRGDSATLFVLWVGAWGAIKEINWVFIVNEFLKE